MRGCDPDRLGYAFDCGRVRHTPQFAIQIRCFGGTENTARVACRIRFWPGFSARCGTNFDLEGFDFRDWAVCEEDVDPVPLGKTCYLMMGPVALESMRTRETPQTPRFFSIEAASTSANFLHHIAHQSYCP